MIQRNVVAIEQLATDLRCHERAGSALVALTIHHGEPYKEEAGLDQP